MKAHLILKLFLAGIGSLALLGAAEKQSNPDVSDHPFWTDKKRGAVPQFVPGLTATLLLTDEQKEQIATARAAMANDAAVKAARAIPKSDPGVTAEQRDKARTTLEAATAIMSAKVDTILTAEQKALIEKINRAHDAAVEETGIVYADKFASVKADEAARRRIQDEKNQDIEELFLHKLDGLLTPAQKEAMTRAAEEEERRNVKSASQKKPAK